MFRRLAFIFAFVAVALASGYGLWHRTLAEGVAQLAARGEADLRLSSDQLATALVQYREVAVFAADHPSVVALARASAVGAFPEPETAGAVSAVLQRMADQAGAAQMFLVDAQGYVLAGPIFGGGARDDEASGGPAIPTRMATTPDLTRARQGATGQHHFLSGGQRYFSFAAPVFAAGGPVVAALVLRLKADRVESASRADPTPVWFTDPQGVIFVANRSEMVLSTEKPMEVDWVAGLGFARSSTAYLPPLALQLDRDLPVVGLTAHTLIDAVPVLRAARAQGLGAGAVILAFGAILFGLGERRRALAEANVALESRVAERTAALSEANARLHRAQADLVQAGKLSALGQMSAGISHELNQPLMAIGSYAENAEVLLERGRTAEVGQNLARISDLARRMGRIIKNLRAFARQEAEPATRVGLAAVVEAALEIVALRLERDGVRIVWQRPDFAAVVMGGEVRLSQVVVNLLTNACDAMEGRAERCITIRIARVRPDAQDGPARIALTLRDTGPGIADASKIFDPFYSTKEVGSAEGMGLGLSISYGLVQGFGGKLRGENVAGGAMFTVELQAAPDVSFASHVSDKKG
ncbi:sensor histidine kinase [Albirhodobacter sp. R86504]|uniref:sensor histidine kinase n=1 Tax=Albirhodobacter sp. R86504 TaxID=3093848 RepID=UPI00366F0D1C